MMVEEFDKEASQTPEGGGGASITPLAHPNHAKIGRVGDLGSRGSPGSRSPFSSGPQALRSADEDC